MKKILFTLLILFGFTQLNAQIDFGIRGGLNYNMASVDYKSTSGAVTSLDPKNKTGYHFGAMLRVKIPLVGLYVEGAPTYTKSLTSIAMTDTNNMDVDADVSSNRLDVPVLLGMEFLGTLRAYAGPVLSWNLNSDISLDGLDEISIDKKMSYGYQVGAGLDIWKLMIDVRYEGAINHSLMMKIGGNDYGSIDNGGSQLLLSVGFKF